MYIETCIGRYDNADAKILNLEPKLDFKIK